MPAGEDIGGIQASGRTALHCLDSFRTNSVTPLYLGRLSGEDSGDRLNLTSKAKSLGRSITASSSDVILYWHIGLLPSLRFLQSKDSPVILFLHGIEAWRKQRSGVQKQLKKVDLFLTNSDYTWKRFIDANPQYKDAPHTTVHLGIQEPADLVARPAQKPIAVSIARMLRSESYKGHKELIDAWPRVRQEIPEAELVFVGSGDLEADLKKSVLDSDLAESIHFEGSTNEDRKRELLLKARCLLLPSRAEGFGLVYVEAMRLGRPSLCGVEDAGREVVNPPEAGLAADPRDPEALTAAIVDLMTLGPRWDTVSRQAKARYDARFTARQFGARLRKAIESL